MASKAVRLVLLVSLCLAQVKTQYRRWKRSPSLFPAAIDLIVCPAGGTLLLLFLLKTRSKAHVPAWRDRWGNPGSPCSFLSPLSIAPTEEIPQEVHRTFQKKKKKGKKRKKIVVSSVSLPDRKLNYYENRRSHYTLLTNMHLFSLLPAGKKVV